MQIQPWNSGSLQVTAAVEQLARVKEPVLTEKQENTAQKQPQTTVKYVSADKVVQIEWTTAGVFHGVCMFDLGENSHSTPGKNQM